MSWLRNYHDKLIVEMERDPPWSGFDKWSASWPLFLCGLVMWAFETITGYSIHDTWLLFVFLAPGIGWMLYFVCRYFEIYVRFFRARRRSKNG